MAQIQTWEEKEIESYENIDNVEKLNVVVGTLVWDGKQQTWRVDDHFSPRETFIDDSSLPKEIDGMIWDPSSLSWKGNDNILDGQDWGEY